eukprot:4207560-Pleurochrysis_carterae.AAC.1
MRKLREAREQRFRDARELQQITTLTPAPATRPKPASAPAKPAIAHIEATKHRNPTPPAFAPP